MNRRVFVILAIAVLAWASTIFVGVSGDPIAQGFRPFIYGREDIARFLEKRGISVKAVDSVRRNASADELFVFLSGESNNRYEALRITTNGIIRLASSRPKGFPALDGHFAAWFSETGSTVVFKGGESIELPKFALFDVDPSGRYFIVGQEPPRTLLGRTASPQKQQMTVVGVLGSTVIANGSRIFVCGVTDTNKPSGRATSAAVCLEIEDDGDNFQIVNRYVFEWADGIRDVDPISNRILLWDKREIYTSVYVIDLATNKRRRLGFAKGFEFFLRTDLLATKY